MQTNYSLENGKIISSEDTKAEIQVIVNPSESEKRDLISTYDLDEHTIQSALDPDELSRFEHQGDHIAVIFKRPESQRGEDHFLFRVASTGLFLFAERLIIVSTEPLELGEVREYRDPGSLTTLALRLINHSIIHFREHLKIINQISDGLQVKIAKAMENRVLLNMFSIQKSLEYYLNAISSNALLLDKLRFNAGRIGFQAEQMEKLDDIAIENTQCAKQAEIYANILASLMDARASIVSNNLNVLMKTLNIITICIMVPTFVVSAFSMNVHIPLEENQHAFYFVITLALISVAFVVFLWRALKW
jgi:magnesium transporter